MLATKDAMEGSQANLNMAAEVLQLWVRVGVMTSKSSLVPPEIELNQLSKRVGGIGCAYVDAGRSGDARSLQES